MRDVGSTKCRSVAVDVSPLLESLKSEDLSVGTWLNVVGYIRPLQHESQSQSQRSSRRNSARGGPLCVVDAVMIFSAGSIEISEYECILSDLLVLEQRVAKSQASA